MSDGCSCAAAVVVDDLEPMPISEIAGLCSDQLQTHVEAWVCDQPPKEQAYRVIKDRWVEDYTVRLILEVEAYEVVPVGSGE